jgi:hypothetical protein
MAPNLLIPGFIDHVVTVETDSIINMYLRQGKVKGNRNELKWSNIAVTLLFKILNDPNNAFYIAGRILG